MTPLKPVIYVDVDDTLIRSYGTKRIPRPDVIEVVRALHETGAQLYCWSRGGAEYAERSAQEVGLEGCFLAYLPKPDILLDDQPLDTWRHLVQVAPEQARALLARYDT